MRKHKIPKRIRAAIYAWSLVVGCLLLIGVSFAWFTKVVREAESKATEVMRPYYLSLLNPGETGAMQLSIGNLIPGNTKQILFCVSNKSNEAINMGGRDFDYSLELVHTDNLALNYMLYALEKADENTEGALVSEDKSEVDGQTVTTYSYWTRGQEALVGADVSEERHIELGLKEAEQEPEQNPEQGSEQEDKLPINSGTYTAYTNENNAGMFHLKDNLEDGYASEYFLLEIEWKSEAVNNFEKYEKETDMIYLLVKALQPEPGKKE